MPIVDVLGYGQRVNFPDDMTQEQMREALKHKFKQERMSFTPPSLEPQGAAMEHRNLSLRDRASRAISNALFDQGVISDRYRANQVGENLTSIGEFMPLAGDIVDADDLGRAAASGDAAGMVMAGLGVVPVVGDAAQAGLRGLRPMVSELLPKGKLGADEFRRIKKIDPSAKTEKILDKVYVKYRDEYIPEKVSSNNDYLFEFDTDALIPTESQFKNIENYEGNVSKPIVVTKKDGDFYILDGHHRAKIAREKNQKIRAFVLPEEDFKTLSEKGIHQADMLKEWLVSADDRITKREQDIVAQSVKESPFKASTGEPRVDASNFDVVMMTPDKYLEEAHKVVGMGGDFDSWLLSNRRTLADQNRYAEAMKSGDKFPMPYIDRAHGSQDGRNRAIAAKKAGIREIPVAVVPELSVAEQIAGLESDLVNARGYGKHRIEEQLKQLKQLRAKSN
jgi:hypothetical protein